MTEVRPLRPLVRDVRVPAVPAVAFDVFTALGSWAPGRDDAEWGRMHALGVLVAAGPLTDTPGAGMAVLRLPGADGLARPLVSRRRTTPASPRACSRSPYVHGP